MHDPEVLVLDEPLNGTDPRQRVEFAEFVERLRTAGRTVLISSHILEEVEALADRILLVVSGKLAASGNHRDIREKLDERPFQVRIMASKQREMAAALVRLESVESVRLEDGAIEVTTRNLADLQRNVPRLARETLGAGYTASSRWTTRWRASSPTWCSVDRQRSSCWPCDRPRRRNGF